MEQILAFNVYLARIPYLPFVSATNKYGQSLIDTSLQMGDSTTMLLYAIPIIYLDSLRYDRTSIPRRNVDAMRLVAGVLQHFDHPAADVCKVSIWREEEGYRLVELSERRFLAGHAPRLLRQSHAPPRMV